MLMLILALSGCADFRPFEALAGLFRGNTKRDYTHYTLDDRVMYRHQKQLDKLKQQAEEEEILHHMDRSVFIKPNTSKNAMMP